MNFPNFPKVPLDRIRIVSDAGLGSAIPALRRMMYGRVPPHGTPDSLSGLPAMTPSAIVAKQVCYFIRVYGRWPT